MTGASAAIRTNWYLRASRREAARRSTDANTERYSHDTYNIAKNALTFGVETVGIQGVLLELDECEAESCIPRAFRGSARVAAQPVVLSVEVRFSTDTGVIWSRLDGVLVEADDVDLYDDVDMGAYGGRLCSGDR
jgi:hypothetical protein